MSELSSFDEVARRGIPDVNSEASMHTGTLEADKDAVADGSPLRVRSIAVDAFPVAVTPLQVI